MLIHAEGRHWAWAPRGEPGRGSPERMHHYRKLFQVESRSLRRVGCGGKGRSGMRWWETAGRAKEMKVFLEDRGLLPCGDRPRRIILRVTGLFWAQGKQLAIFNWST